MESKAAFVLKEIKTQKGNHFLWKNVSHSLSLSLLQKFLSLYVSLSLSHPIFISGILSLTNTLSHNGCLSLSLTHTLSLSLPDVLNVFEIDVHNFFSILKTAARVNQTFSAAHTKKQLWLIFLHS